MGIGGGWKMRWNSLLLPGRQTTVEHGGDVFSDAGVTHDDTRLHLPLQLCLPVLPIAPRPSGDSLGPLSPLRLRYLPRLPAHLPVSSTSSTSCSLLQTRSIPTGTVTRGLEALLVRAAVSDRGDGDGLGGGGGGRSVDRPGCGCERDLTVHGSWFMVHVRNIPRARGRMTEVDARRAPRTVSNAQGHT